MDLKYTGYKYDETYKNAKRINIADVGKGISNLAGLIIKIYYIKEKLFKERGYKERYSYVKNQKKPKPRIILIEEPEIFLHPNFQSKIADFILFCIKELQDFDVKFIIERLQYLVAQEKISNQNVFVYYFNGKSDEELFFEMGLRKDGIFKKKFGEGFYDETANRTLDLLNINNYE